MKIFELNPDIGVTTRNNKQISIAIGIFDGVHRGHVKLLNESRLNNICTAVLTFYPHPKKEGKLIQSLRNRLYTLRTLGLNKAIVYTPLDNVLSLTAEEFVENELIPLGVKHIYISGDFRLGRDRKTDAEGFKAICKDRGISVNIVSPETDDGVKISSSDIRKCIANGDVQKAGFLLGRPYSISGHVSRGRCIAKELGFRTANIKPSKRLVIPKNGVYITKTTVDKKEYDSFTYVGTSPTLLSTEQVLVESHILGFDKNLYGKRIEVAFIKRLRDEIKFKSVEELVAAIKKDLKTS